jgi:hypothetical protein
VHKVRKKNPTLRYCTTRAQFTYLDFGILWTVLGRTEEMQAITSSLISAPVCVATRKG